MLQRYRLPTITDTEVLMPLVRYVVLTLMPTISNGPVLQLAEIATGTIIKACPDSAWNTTEITRSIATRFVAFSVVPAGRIANHRHRCRIVNSIGKSTVLIAGKHPVKDGMPCRLIKDVGYGYPLHNKIYPPGFNNGKMELQYPVWICKHYLDSEPPSPIDHQ